MKELTQVEMLEVNGGGRRDVPIDGRDMMRERKERMKEHFGRDDREKRDHNRDRHERKK